MASLAAVAFPQAAAAEAKGPGLARGKASALLTPPAIAETAAASLR